MIMLYLIIEIEKITPTVIRKGSGKIVGNIWGHCLHIEEGQEIFYATYS